MQNLNTAPRWMQVLIGLGLGGIAGAALRVDILNNYEYGASVSAELATVMVIAAVCVGALPAIAGVFGWSWLLRGLTGFCVVLTCWAAVNAYANKMGHEILKQTGAQEQYVGAKADQERARATLDRIKETADTATLERLIAEDKKSAEVVALERRIAKAKAEYEAIEESDTRKMGKKSCFRACRETKGEHSTLLDRLAEAKAKDAADHKALLDRLADAKARDSAKAELAKAKGEAKAGPAEASMVATWIATRTEQNAADIARTISLVMTIASIIVTQGVALLAHPAANLVFGGVKAHRVPRDDDPGRGTVPEIRPRRPVSAAAIKNATIRNEFDAFEFTLGKLRSAPGRVYRGSANQLADEAGVARSTFASWVQRWVAEGRIETLRQGRITEFRFPQQPRLRRVV